MKEVETPFTGLWDWLVSGQNTYEERFKNNFHADEDTLWSNLTETYSRTQKLTSEIPSLIKRC